MRRLRLLTSGESHGPGLSGVLEGLPAGMRVSTLGVDRDLVRRQHGYGSGRRMLIERDRVRWTAGIRYGRTLGSPVGFAIDNRDWVNWTERMSIEPIPDDRRPKPITRARPGHVDLAGALKYDTDDIRNVLERASARSTTPRVVAGALARQLLAMAAGVRIWSFVDQLGEVRAFPDADDPLSRIPSDWPKRDLAAPSPLRCPDPDAEAAMLAAVDAAREAGDSIGGSYVVVAERVPIGLGSSSEWDTRLDGLLAGAVMSIPGVKGVEVGLGFGVIDRAGSAVHDVVDTDAPWRHATNRAGGIEGGISNGEPIVVRAAQKPVATLRSPLPSVDLATGELGRAHIERSDVTVLARAAIVGEALVALILADQLLHSFGGDTIGDLRAAVLRRRRRTRRR